MRCGFGLLEGLLKFRKLGTEIRVRRLELLDLRLACRDRLPGALGVHFELADPLMPVRKRRFPVRTFLGCPFLEARVVLGSLLSHRSDTVHEATLGLRRRGLQIRQGHFDGFATCDFLRE